MSKWPLVPLSQIATQGQYGLNAPAMKEGNGVRFIRITDIDERSNLRTTGSAFVPGGDTAALDKYLLSPGDLLIARSGATAGKSLLFEGLKEPAVFAGYLIRFQVDRSIALPSFVAAFFKSSTYWAYINATKRAAAQPNINAQELGAIPIPLPPLDEQRRIVDLLSQAEEIVRLRGEAQKKAAAVIPALFLDKFGDPATNPKGLRVRHVKDFVAAFEGGKNLQAAGEGSTDFRILKVSAVTKGVYLETESKPTPEEYVPPQNHIVRVGDMLFSRANTEELVGATALVEATNGYSLLPDKLWRFVWAEPVEQRYMHALFQNAYVRQELGKLSSGTSASMRNISQAKLFELRLPIAPLEQQAAFARHAETMQSVLTQQSAARKKAEEVFLALLAQAFSSQDFVADPLQEKEAAVA